MFFFALWLFIYLRGAPFANYKIHDNMLNHQYDIVNYDNWNTVCKFFMACHSNHKRYKTYDGYHVQDARKIAQPPMLLNIS